MVINNIFLVYFVVEIMVEIRMYQEGDETAILNLFGLAFGKKMSLDYWKWRYKQNPFGVEPMVCLMFDNDELIGHYAVFPVEMIIDSKIQLSAFSMTTMTHPDHQGKGIFKTLAQHLYEYIYTKFGINLIWGFPNLNSHYGFVKNLNWKDVGLLSNLKLETFVKIRESWNFEFEKFDDFTISSSGNFDISNQIRINKSKEYLNWRYFSNPDNQYFGIRHRYNHNFFIVYKYFRFYDKLEIDIVEIEFGNNHLLLTELIECVVKVSFDDGKQISGMNLWCNIHSNNYILFEKIGFKPSLPLTYLGCRDIHSINTNYSLNNWFISMGDSDVY